MKKFYSAKATKKLVAALGEPTLDRAKVITALDAGANPHATAPWALDFAPASPQFQLPVLAVAALADENNASNFVLTLLMKARASVSTALEALAPVYQMAAELPDVQARMRKATERLVDMEQRLFGMYSPGDPVPGRVQVRSAAALSARPAPV